MNRILTAAAAGIAGLMMLSGPALADRDDDRWRGHDGGRYERHDRDHDRHRGEWRHGRHDDRHWDRGRHDRHHAHRGHGRGHGKHHWRYKHDHRFWSKYDRWYRSHGRHHHRHGWDRRDPRLVIIFEHWLDGGHRHHYRDRGHATGGIYLNFPIRIGH